MMILHAVSKWQLRFDKAISTLGLIARFFASMKSFWSRAGRENIELADIVISNLVFPFGFDNPGLHRQVPDAKTQLDWEFTEAMECLWCHFGGVVGSV